MNKEKETTIDDLARVVQKGFESTSTKNDIVEVNARLDRINIHLVVGLPS